MDITQYITQRVNEQEAYFSTRSKLNKKYYQFFRVTQLVAAALLPFFSAFISEGQWIRYTVAALGTLVAILEGILTVGKYHEKWINYRTTLQILRQEKYLFGMRAGEYAEAGAAGRFVANIELLLGRENAHWKQLVVKENDKPIAQQNAAAPGNDINSSTSESADTQPSPIDPITGVPNDGEEINEDRHAGL